MDLSVRGSSFSSADTVFAKNYEILEPGKTFYAYRCSKGVVGITLSHLSILYDAYRSMYSIIWVMEDDIEILENPNHIPKLIQELDKQTHGRWDILFTDRDARCNTTSQIVECHAQAYRPDYAHPNPNQQAIRKNISNNLRRIGSRYGAYSIIINRSGIGKLLSFFLKHKMFNPFDIDYFMPPDMKLYTTRKDYVSHKPNSPSDNNFPNYKP